MSSGNRRLDPKPPQLKRMEGQLADVRNMLDSGLHLDQMEGCTTACDGP